MTRKHYQEIAKIIDSKTKKTKADILLLSKYEDAILNIIDNVDNLTRSDLQGTIHAQLKMLLNEIRTNIK